jgi:hypothetical protein
MWLDMLTGKQFEDRVGIQCHNLYLGTYRLRHQPTWLWEFPLLLFPRMKAYKHDLF